VVGDRTLIEYLRIIDWQLCQTEDCGLFADFKAGLPRVRPANLLKPGLQPLAIERATIGAWNTVLPGYT